MLKGIRANLTRREYIVIGLILNKDLIILQTAALCAHSKLNENIRKKFYRSEFPQRAATMTWDYFTAQK